MNEAALLQEIKNLKQRVESLETQNAELAEQVRLLKHLKFGIKSEKLTKEDKRTIPLFNEAEDEAFTQNNEQEIEKVLKTTEVKPHQRTTSKTVGRKLFDESLPREIVDYDLEESEKICACGSSLHCIGEDVTERLKIHPERVVVLQERRKKYVCRSCEGLESEDEKGVTTAKGIKHLIPGSLADESFLAWSISQKFEFSLPFYRQAIRLGQIGAPIPRATLSNLAIKTAEKCKPLWDLLRQNVTSGSIINADETRLQVLKEPGRRNQSQSWMWVFLGGESEKRSVVFQYEPSRAHSIPYEFLQSYAGWLQTDDYEAYHTAVRKLNTEKENKIQHVLCWAHVRRRFYQYWQQSKDKSVKQILDLIGELFKLEDLRMDYSSKGFVKQRKNRAGPLFDQLKQLLMEMYPKVPPSLAFGRAIGYTLDNWEQLILNVDHPEMTPSNNIAERAIKPFVVGRKNWLFAGSPGGAEASAILYSLIESAKLQGLIPYEYLYYVFSKIPNCQTSEDWEALLPFRVNPEQLRLTG